MGSFARLMRVLFAQEKKHQVVGFCADDAFVTTDHYDELPLYTLRDTAECFGPESNLMFVAVGYSSMRARSQMYGRAKAAGYNLVNYISPHAVLPDNLVIGENNAIFQGAQIEPGVQIGDNNIIWSSVNLCHDVVIGSHSFMAARSLMGGGSSLGNSCFVGFNATITHRIAVADETLVGAGALILNDTEPFTRYQGVPAKPHSVHACHGIKIP